MSKERPILFSEPMVQAILDGRKTQTRRPVKPVGNDHSFVLCDGWPYRSDDGESIVLSDGQEIPHKCPYGKPGDRLWVRETWAWWPADGSDKKEDGVIYRAEDDDWECRMFKWRPSIHMPRWASRILLEITDVRVERLNEMTCQDARSEGVIDENWDIWREDVENIALPENCTFENEKDVFKNLWTKIYGPCSWDENPLVWVVEFKVVKVKK